ncbi:mediator complex protein-domain-containing protein [Scheffersomyces coipomensis]|uniref:mediator complex protein-domain-containing protein n=1 Tax=Scheffersomyces coipomensis TaxID=1788519 RepID=UPI00315C6621
MSLIEEKADTYVQERLDALYEIDCKIVSLLDGISTLFQTYSTTKNNTNTHQLKEQLSDQTENVYDILSKVAIDLRKEVKAMDGNIGVYDKNKDGVMILPIGVEQKNSSLGKKKLNESLKELDGLLGITEEEEVVEEEVVPKEEPKPEVNDKDGDVDVEMEEVEAVVPTDDIPKEEEPTVEIKEVVPEIAVEETKDEVKEEEATAITTDIPTGTIVEDKPEEAEADDDDDLFEDV